MAEAVIVSAVRTPVGRLRGALSAYQADELAGMVLREAVIRGKADPKEIEDVFLGNCRNVDLQTPARVSALAAGLPQSVPGVTVERGCASSLCAVYYAAAMIRAGEGAVYLAGGTESTTHAPFLMEKQTAPSNRPPRFLPGRMVPMEMENLSMGMTSERVAQAYGITRADCDAFALLSQQRAAAAWGEGRFDGQILPVAVKDKKTAWIFSKDETLRPDTTLEGLSALRPSFLEDGVSTAGNSSPLTDGASALLLMEADRARAAGAEALASVRGFASAGCEPELMGMGPVYAVRKLLARMGLTLADIDLVELNEAFAAQSVACIRELGLDMERVNVNGGAIALGHPFGATGGILTVKMVHELRRRDLRRGVVAFCIGGGQGAAMLLERA